MKILLIGSGEINSYEKLKSKMLSSYDKVIAVDGGANHLEGLQLEPSLLIGDFDSIDEDIYDSYEHVKRERYPSEKDFTDSELAFDIIKCESPDFVHIIGFWGSRWDHSLSNLMLLVKYKDLHIVMLDENNEAMYCHKKTSIKKKKGHFLSLIPFNDISELTIKHVKYPLDKKNIQWPSSLTLSNEILGDEATIEYQSGDMVILISKD